MDYKYYLTYLYISKKFEPLPIRCCDATLRRPISSDDDLKEIVEAIKKENDYEEVVILGFSKFEKENKNDT